MNTKTVLKKELLIYLKILLFLPSVKERCPDRLCASDYVVDTIKNNKIYISFFCTKGGFIYHNTTVVTSRTSDVI